MLKGIEKNLKENYNQIIEFKRKDQLKTKDDVPVLEAFELYMLKRFHNIKLNSLTNKMLSFWENDFDKAIEKHIEFLKENLEFQNNYSSKFSEILKEMEIFHNEENEKNNEENQDIIKIIPQMMIRKVIMMIKKIKIIKRKLKLVWTLNMTLMNIN